MTRPAVVVVTRRTTRKNRLIDYVAELHLELLTRLGLCPIMVPVVRGTPANLPQYARGMRGLLLVEGGDVEPKRYHVTHADNTRLEEVHPIRDELEVRLARLALRRRIPILGICRGSQILNVVAGGTLHVDVQAGLRSSLKHVDPDHYDAYRHPVAITAGTPLARWYRTATLPVNSFHHQGINKLARRFMPMARAEDGLIEGFYDPAARFVVGLQFHPERMLAEHPGNLRVWKAFAAAVRR